MLFRPMIKQVLLLQNLKLAKQKSFLCISFDMPWIMAVKISADVFFSAVKA